MQEHIHPADPSYLLMQLGETRFALENGRDPSREERVQIVKDKLGLTGDDADAFLKSADRTEELREIAESLVEQMLPTMFGGAFAPMARGR